MVVGPLLARFRSGLSCQNQVEIKLVRRRLDTHFEGFIQLLELSLNTILQIIFTAVDAINLLVLIFT
jgi:hypothetical protein